MPRARHRYADKKVANSKLSQAEQDAVIERVEAIDAKKTSFKRKPKPRKRICTVYFNPMTAQYDLDDSNAKITGGIQLFQDLKAEILKNPGFHKPILGGKRDTLKIVKMQKKKFLKTLPVSSDQKKARAKFFDMIAKNKLNGYKNLKGRTAVGNYQRMNAKIAASAEKRAKIAAQKGKPHMTKGIEQIKKDNKWKPEKDRYGIETDDYTSDPRVFKASNPYVTQRYRGVDDMDDDMC